MRLHLLLLKLTRKLLVRFNCVTLITPMLLQLSLALNTKKKLCPELGPKPSPEPICSEMGLTITPDPICPGKGRKTSPGLVCPEKGSMITPETVCPEKGFTTSPEHVCPEKGLVYTPEPVCPEKGLMTTPEPVFDLELIRPDLSRKDSPVTPCLEENHDTDQGSACPGLGLLIAPAPDRPEFGLNCSPEHTHSDDNQNHPPVSDSTVKGPQSKC